MASTFLILGDPTKTPLQSATQAISASTTKTGTLFRAPKSGNIRYIGTTFTALSGSPALDLRIETVASKLPTGTLFGTNTNASYSPGATNTFAWTQLTADAAVTEADIFAAVVEYTSGTSATSLYGVSAYSSPMRNGSPIALVMASGSWALSDRTPTIAVKYDDGTIIRGCMPISSWAGPIITSSTNPNERATVFVAPAGFDCAGIRFVSTRVDDTGSLVASIYSGTSTTALDSATMAAGSGVAGALTGVYDLYFGAAVSLTSGTTYRLGIQATGAGNIGTSTLSFASTDDRDAAMGPMWADTRNGSSWIGESTTTTHSIFPIMTATAASGGGGLINGGLITTA